MNLCCLAHQTKSIVFANSWNS